MTTPLNSDCGHECFVIGGPFISEDPDCPVHGVNARVLNTDCVYCGRVLDVNAAEDSMAHLGMVVCDVCVAEDRDGYQSVASTSCERCEAEVVEAEAQESYEFHGMVLCSLCGGH